MVNKEPTSDAATPADTGRTTAGPDATVPSRSTGDEATFASDQPDTRIGAYRLLRLLGSGGMGAVWLAERQDGQFNKQVALKLLHAGMADTELRARFLQERQILASLQHPNIAGLFDGGVSADGRPFFAMEFVDGKTITHYCDLAGLDVRDRVRLFLQVLRAVAHAHQRLIVHRDLKPSNVMVNSERVVKLLDFGIAKILQSPSQAVVTQLGDRAMTPRYAAPEQIRGEPVTVATDVYALGVTLFEILTGRTPYLGHSGRQDMEVAILTMEPCRPGQTLAPNLDRVELDPVRERFERGIDKRRLRRELSGDLELIVLKALRKEAEQRYSSVEAFSADLERYLDGRPIVARAPTLRYRAGKWLGRHALAAASAAVSLILLMGGLVFLYDQRERANQAAARAEATQDFLIGLFEEAGPDRGGNVNSSVRDILARGAARAEQELDGQDGLQRRLSGLIGRLMNDVGDYARAEPVLRRTVAALDDRPVDDPDRLDAEIQLALTLGRLGHYAESEERWQRVLQSAPAASEQRADAHSGLGGLYARMNRFEESIAQHNIAIGMWRHAGPRHAERLAKAQLQLAYALDYADQSDAAAIQLQEAVDLLRALPQTPSTLLGRTLHQFGANQRNRGELGAARASLQESGELLTNSLGIDHEDTLHARRLLGDVLDEMGDQDAAHQLLSAVFDDAMRRYGEDSRASVETANSLASIDLLRGHYVEAERRFRIVVRALIAEFGEQHAESAVALANLSNALFEQGRFEEASQTNLRSIKAAAGSIGKQSTGYALSLFAQARIHRAKGELGEARSRLEESERILAGILGEQHSQTLRARHALAAIIIDEAGDPRTALDLLDHVERHVELESRRGRRLRIEVLMDRARAVAAEDPATAESLLQESLAIGGSEYPGGHRTLATVAYELSALQMARGKLRDARASFERAERSNPNRQPFSERVRALRDMLARRLGAAG